MFNVMNMRSVRAPHDADLTARARLRDTAVECFAREGFGASVRTIAAQAGTSPGLVIHHFGSKQALREECDAQVLDIIRVVKQESIREAAAGQSLLHRFAATEELAPILGYVLRSVQAGGPVASAFVEQLIADAVTYCAEGVRSGVLHPSRDEAARARYLTLSALGALLMEIQLRPSADFADIAALIRDFLSTSYAPMIELYTQGFFTDSRLFEDYLRALSDPPADE